LDYFDIPFEECSVFDRDPSSFDVPDNPALAAELYAVRNLNAPFDDPDDAEVLCFDLSLDSGFGAYGQVVAGDLESALYLAIHVQILITEDLTLDANAAAQVRSALRFRFRKTQC